ncbi:MAG: phosphodiester glycosidase family protein [Treponema sp.]|nr:phosphodiester glycosidase family protein [Treponema sp.]
MPKAASFGDKPFKTKRRPVVRSLVLCPLVFIFLSCVTLSPVDSVPEKPSAAAGPESLVPNWQPLPDSGGALAWFAGRISRPGFEFRVLRADLSSPALRIVAAAGGPSADRAAGTFSVKVSSFVRDNGLYAGINALPFDPVSGREGEPRVNEGIVVAAGVMISPPHPEFDAVVFYADGSPAIVSQPEIVTVSGIETAAGGFYQILQNGECTARASGGVKRHPRSAAGLSADGRFLYLLVIDGRRLRSVGATEPETALVLRALGAWQGINFDGGGSSAMALRFPGGKVRVVNTPIHGGIPGRERAVAGCLGVSIQKTEENIDEKNH